MTAKPDSHADASRTLVDIAVLDDDPDFLQYIEDLLRDEGLYSVRTCSTPAELFEAAELRRPDIVLLDMKMGEARGEQVLEKLLARYAGLCVVVITGYPTLEDMRATFKLNVFDYIAKPFSLSQLRQVLANAVEAFSLGRSLQDRLRDRLGHRIRMMRVEREWGLKELSEASKLSVSQISSIERGANLPSIESLLAIAHAFGTKPSEILAAIEF